MTASILVTKLFIPATRPELVHRPSLIKRLNDGLNRKLTLISAPAGFGKTTLVSEWVDTLRLDAPEEKQIENKITWLSLDERDNAPTRFLVYLIAALRTIDENIAKGVLSALQSPQPPPTEMTLTTLINEIAAIPDLIILVLDDYHLIEAQPVHEALTFLLENQPPHLHLVITTREDPPLPLARLRVRGQLTELRAADLRFTSSEAAEFLNQAMGLDLSAEDITALETRTEGWIAGLQLAAISMKGREDAASLIKSFTGSHRLVLDYLIEEVLEQQSESVQAFLLQSSILDRLTGSLCDAITGQDDGQATLEMLERANLFIVPLDTERHWYRYHQLFADILRQRLRQTQPEILPIFHVRAGEWFNHQGLKREAIKHWLAAKDYQGATDLIRTIAIDIIQLGDHLSVVRWINAIPDELVKEQPYLCVLHAWALLLSGQFEATEARLIDAENAFDRLKYQDDEDADTINGLIHSHRAYLSFFHGDHDKAISYARKALDQLPETAILIRVQTALYMGASYRHQGKLKAAKDIFNETLTLTQTIEGNLTPVMCYINLGELYLEEAKLCRAKEIYENALKFTEQNTGRPEMPFSGLVYVRIGTILRQRNQLRDAHRLTKKGVALSQELNEPNIMAMSRIELAYICQALGDEEQALASIQEAIRLYETISPWASKLAASHQAKINMELGDINASIKWAQENDLVIDGEFQFGREIEYLTLARVFIAQKQIEEAHSLVKRIIRIAQENGRRHTELEGLILLAILFSAQGETDQALFHLEQALSIGEPEGFIRIFMDEGPPMAGLLYVALSRGIAPNYVRRLLATFPDAEPVQNDPTKFPAPEAEWVEPLSEREIEVIQLVAEGLTNKEIATRLYLSLNTIKVHTRNINGKLGVKNRMQAAARARALGILPNN